MPQGLPRRIRFAFMTQAVLAALAVVVGVVVAMACARYAVVRYWLEAEAVQAQTAEGGALVRRWVLPPGGDPAAIPRHVLDLSEGFSTSMARGSSSLRRQTPQGELFLVASTGPVDRVLLLATAGLLAYGLATTLLITWITYRRSRRMVLPVNRLAEVVSQWDPGSWDEAVPVVLPYPLTVDPSREVRALSTALRGLAGRIASFVQRERDFTRDASHELRTPLTVVRVATDLLQGDPTIPAHAQRTLQRIQRAVRDMEVLVDAFLILARERGVAPQSEEFEVRALVEEEVEKARPLLAGKPVELRITGDASPRLYAPPRVFAVMLGQLLSNACTFTESGSVEVELGQGEVRVRDTGIGMSAETLRQASDPFFRADRFNPAGKGIGLTIVRRLGDRFGWPVELESTPGQGTVATIRFGHAPVS